MMEQVPGLPQFFLTPPAPCPYLEGHVERRIFTYLPDCQAGEINNLLSLDGFRRLEKIAYRPACHGCRACVSVRVKAHHFVPHSSQRRIIKMNSDLIAHILPARATREQYILFRRYLNRRHADSAMVDMTMKNYQTMVEGSPIDTQIVEYRLDIKQEKKEGDDLLPPTKGKLVAVALIDVLADGYSMVYSFYRPELTRRSLGSWMILNHIDRARTAGLPYVYLGYWVDGSQKMDYKRRFQPLEQFLNHEWQSFDVKDHK